MPVQLKKTYFSCPPGFRGMVVRESSGKVFMSYFIEKTVIFPMENFIIFLSDMRIGRFFFEKNHMLCRIDQEGIWHCLLVKPCGQKEGVLVLANEDGLPICIALYQR